MSKKKMKEECANNKIAFIINSPGDGGSEGVCVNIANGLADRGWHVDLVCMNLKRKNQLNKISKKVNLVNLDISRFALSFIPIIYYLKRKRVKHIVCFNYIFALQLVVQKFLLNNQFKIIARNNTSLSSHIRNNFSNNIFKKLIFMVIKILYPKVDYSIAQCEEMKIELVRNFGFDSNKVKVIFNPINDKIENSYEYKKNKKEKFILIVGRLSKEKKLDVAIKVFSKVKKKFLQLKLKILGQGQEESFLRQVAKKYEIYDSVEFLGFQKNLVPLYQKAKLTLMTSSYEGFPNTLIESVTLGTPIISFNCPTGPREIIQDGINGFLVNADDEIMLEQKIIEALNIDWNHQQIHNTSFRYSYEKIMNEFEDFFYQFINQNK
ncbi:glycosyltransferase [Candidatus Pelagibacter sp.]|nr:glycosyltransferase [Candidatus Pelagibacter sp.]